MHITFYQNNSPVNALTKELTQVTTMEGDPLEDMSITRPRIVFTFEGPPQANYVYIQEFSRYYFIKNVDWLEGQFWAVSMEIDVLQTYADEIKEQTAIIARQEHLYNLYQQDDRFGTYIDSWETNKRVGEINDTFNIVDTDNRANFVLMLN